ncbi:Polyadenylate-binding protein 1 [Thoreauomyces humboldtii]|nr:Polyadenylate-binding protein 1 [Thoreauomyces humboldtii]
MAATVAPESSTSSMEREDSKSATLSETDQASEGVSTKLDVPKVADELESSTVDLKDPTAAPADDMPTSVAAAAAEAAVAAYQPAPSTYPAIGPPASATAAASAPVTSANASLYIGDLDGSVTEAQLFEVFNSVGPVASIRVCRDAVTRRSLGYGYVNFQAVADAERALTALNYALLKDRPVRIMWSQRDPSTRKIGTGNIFIKNLDPLIDTRALHETFSAFGPILSCKVAMDGETSRGYGFVHFEDIETAEQAISQVNGMLLNERKVYVGHHTPRKERMSKVEEMKANYTNVYVKNLADSIDHDRMLRTFGEFGQVTSAVLCKDSDGKSRGFGFVNFSSHGEARNAVQNLHEKEVDGKQLYVGRAQKKAEREAELRRKFQQVREEKLIKFQGVNLYVKNLDNSIDDEKLRQEFAVYGVIASTKVMRDDKTGMSRGFGFVCFNSPEEATRAVTDMNGRMIAGKPIYVALAQRKEIRHQQLAAQMQQRHLVRMQQAVGGMGYGAQVFYPPSGHPNQRPPQLFYPPHMGPRPPRWAQQGPIAPGQPLLPYPTGGQLPQFVASQGAQGLARTQRPMANPRGQFPLQSGLGPNLAMMNLPGGRGIGRGSNGSGGRGGFKYIASARNAPPQFANSAPHVPGPPAGKAPIVNSKMLADMPPEKQKRMLGESLFPIVQRMTPHAGKVTGMLLEMDQSELLHLLEDGAALKSKVVEAVSVLDEHLIAPY